MSNAALDTLPRNAVGPSEEAASLSFRVAVFTRDQVVRCRHWQRAFADERKDHRYYELVEDTIQPEFDYRYFVIQQEYAKYAGISSVILPRDHRGQSFICFLGTNFGPRR